MDARSWRAGTSASEGVLVWYAQTAGCFSGEEPIYWLVDLASGEQKAFVAPGRSDQELGWVHTVRFSSDGTRVMTSTRNTDPDYQLWIMEIATGHEILLVESLQGAMVVDFGMVTS